MKAHAFILAPPVMEDVTAWLQINEDESLRSEIPILNITSLWAARTSLERWLAKEYDQSPYFLRLIRMSQNKMENGDTSKVIAVNRNWGRELVKYGAQGNNSHWKLRQAHLSPCFTTRLDQVKKICI